MAFFISCYWLNNLKQRCPQTNLDFCAKDDIATNINNTVNIFFIGYHFSDFTKENLPPIIGKPSIFSEFPLFSILNLNAESNELQIRVSF